MCVTRSIRLGTTSAAILFGLTGCLVGPTPHGFLPQGAAEICSSAEETEWLGTASTDWCAEPLPEAIGPEPIAARSFGVHLDSTLVVTGRTSGWNARIEGAAVERYVSEDGVFFAGFDVSAGDSVEFTLTQEGISYSCLMQLGDDSGNHEISCVSPPPVE